VSKQLDKIKVISDQYHDYIAKLGRQDTYTIHLRDYYVDWIEEEFERHKITRVDNEKSKKMAKELAKLEDEEDVELKLNKMIDMYKFLASCYLHMSEKDFVRADWEELKDVINACELRTSMSIAYVDDGLYHLFSDGKASLSPAEHEAYEMFRLWKKWNTKPWEYNGGYVYPEDIRCVLKMEEFELKAEEKAQKKAEFHARRKSQ
jgi:hypothetical protein